MPTVVVRHPDGSEEELELVTELWVGRADGNDIILSEGGVSRRHARLFVEGGRVLVEDRGSANGTYVDGERIDGPTELSPKAQVVIGEYEIQLKRSGVAVARGAPPKPRPRNGAALTMMGDEGTTAQPPVKAARPTRVVPQGDRSPKRSTHDRPAPDEPKALAKKGPGGLAAPDLPSLKGLTGPWLNKVYPIRGTITVGRVPGLEVHLEDDSVSRRHAELERTAEGVVLRDLGSANGTTVNGEPVEGDVLLKSGDVVQFGVIEMVFESPDAPKVRRSGPAEAAAGGGLPKRRKLLLIGGSAVAGLLLIAGLLKVLLTPPPSPAKAPPQPLANLDPTAELSEHLSECRSYSNPDLGNLDWGRAEAACNKALDIDPIHPEANQLIRRIRTERECGDYFEKADKAMQRLYEEEALELLGKITPDCQYYYFRAKPKVEEAIDGVMKKTSDDCKRYMASGNAAAALPRCELYMKFACQNMKPDQLQPPPGYKLVLDGRPNVRRREWQPKDKMYLLFLKARDKVDPGAPAWTCPPMKIVRKEQAPPDPKADVKKAFQQRYADKELATAMELYFDGKYIECNNLLQRFLERTEKASFHLVARELQKNITSVDALFKEGQTALQNERIERAVEPFREALEFDEKLMLDPEEQKAPPEQRKALMDKRRSHYRRNIEQDMASSAYLRGKALADRRDFRGACKVWKIGFDFYRGNTELLRALNNVCTFTALQELEAADGCDALLKVLDFAVDGDGVKEKVQARRAELKCG